ncbi:helix-turn-helix domain-containing protein [Clostridium lacusfryxellense]|uniref:helix-turn-helix domain-containing protein n=1 Tax=Clostridium lacusfryxellense TaxID=205328 RepID=UPI001C0E5549|nr:helix-turn-helix domain-containing protein [Clostridium lacusfryxellense]
MSKLLTVHEVSNLLQVHFNTVYELVRQNKIKHIRIGKQIRITENAFNEFISCIS